jgi:hypothetical protein
LLNPFDSISCVVCTIDATSKFNEIAFFGYKKPTFSSGTSRATAQNR